MHARLRGVLKGDPVESRFLCLCQATVFMIVAAVGWTGEARSPDALVFEESAQAFPAVSTSDVALGDVDGDGDLDAVLAHMQQTPSEIWLNDGTGRLVDSGQRLTAWAHGLGLADFDHDGDLDLFVTCASYAYRSRVYLNDGAGEFTDSGQVLPDRAESGNGVQLADFDGDGDLDVLVEYYDRPDVIYINDGTARFTPSGLEVPEEATPGDLDGDGDTDLFVKVPGTGYETYLNDGTGRFTEGPATPDSRVGAGWVALCDVDGDGDLDAIVPNGDGTTPIPTILLLNDGNGRFADTGQDLGSSSWGYPVLGDLNRDGSVDFVLVNFGQAAVVWANDGAGGFTRGPQLDAAAGSLCAAVGDLNGDGLVDLLTACFADCSDIVWLNASLTGETPSADSERDHSSP
jgi:hypothetical protein